MKEFVDICKICKHEFKWYGYETWALGAGGPTKCQACFTNELNKILKLLGCETLSPTSEKVEL